MTSFMIGKTYVAFEKSHEEEGGVTYYSSRACFIVHFNLRV